MASISTRQFRQKGTVPHGFDIQDHTEESRAAVRQAMAWVPRALGRP